MMSRLRSLAVVLIAASSSVANATPTQAAPTKVTPTKAPPAKPPLTGPGTATVKQANTTIGTLLKQKVPAGSKAETELATKVTASIRGFLDIDQLGERAMVDHWAKLTKEQHAQFQQLLRALIEDSYVRGLRANISYETEYAGEATDKAGNVVVATRINTQRKGRPYTIKVDYVLVKDGAGLRAWDVRTDGVGLVENYRTMFNKIMTRDGFDGLIAKMKKKRGASS